MRQSIDANTAWNKDGIFKIPDDISSTYSTTNLSLKTPNRQETEEQKTFYISDIVHESWQKG